ncbi:MAG TPA: hypothetical protein VKU42_02980, partial [Candidatus Angelobacter sp.]|nr:hypothetical protein [Candidatus Angelobacter sp.]
LLGIFRTDVSCRVRRVFAGTENTGLVSTHYMAAAMDDGRKAERLWGRTRTEDKLASSCLHTCP